MTRTTVLPLDLMLNLTNIPEDQAEYVKDLQRAMDASSGRALEAFIKSKNSFKNRLNPRNADYPIGTKILVRNFRKKNKFDKKFLSNFVIMKRHGPATYLVKNLTTLKLSKINIKDIKYDHNNPENIDEVPPPLEVETATDDFEANNVPPEEIENPSDGEIDLERDLELEQDHETTRFGRVVKKVNRLGIN